MRKDLCIEDPNPLNLSISPAQLDINMMRFGALWKPAVLSASQWKRT